MPVRFTAGRATSKVFAAKKIGFAALAFSALFLLPGCRSSIAPTLPTGQPAATGTVQAQVTPTRPEPGVTPAAVSTLDVDPQDLQGVALDFWHVWLGEQGEKLQALIGLFNQTNEFGITVQATYAGNYNDLNERIHEGGGGPEGQGQGGQAFATTPFEIDLPDLVVGYPYHLRSWTAGNHSLVDLNVFVLDPVWGYSQAEQADFYPAFWQEDLSAGVRWGLPIQRSGQLLFYNATWASELGFYAPPQTPAEFKQQACAAAQTSSPAGAPAISGTGGWAINTNPSAVLSWMYAFGSQVANRAGTGYLFNTPETEQALVFLKDLYDSRCAWLVEGDTAENEFASRQALFVTGSLAELPYQTIALDIAENEDDWTVIPFPSIEAQPVITTYGPSVAIFGSSPQEQLAAWLFLKWLASPAIQADWVESSGLFPVRASALFDLEEYAAAHPQWQAASRLLPYARGEPAFASWRTVRWAVSDVGTQTFRSYFTADRIPATLKLLDETAAELHVQIR